MGYKRYKMLQKYINGEPQDEYRQGELIDDTVYNTLEACNEGNDNPDEPIYGAIYQWVVISDTYDCVNYSKYTREKEQISYDSGVSWEDTGQTRRGDLLEANSTDCGYNHILYRYEDDKVLFEMYEPCWSGEGADRRSRLNLRVWNKTENGTVRTKFFREGAYIDGWAYTEPQTDETFTHPFTFSTFYNVHNYYIEIGVNNSVKYRTDYFAFTSREIRNECS